MNRALAMLMCAGLLVALAVGCGDYDLRLNKTLDEMKYQEKLKKNLGEAPTKGRLEQLAIYVRPPLNLTGPTQTFALTTLEPGRFDVENSFIDSGTQAALHVLGRVKQPQANKKQAKTAAEAARGVFQTEVMDIVKAVYGLAPDAALKLKDETKRHGNRSNAFKGITFDLEAKRVQVYFYGDKNTAYEVALIFEYPKTEHADLNPKIGYCLESFGTGQVAKRLFAGGDAEGGEDTGEGAGAPPPI